MNKRSAQHHRGRNQNVHYSRHRLPQNQSNDVYTIFDPTTNTNQAALSLPAKDDDYVKFEFDLPTYENAIKMKQQP